MVVENNLVVTEEGCQIMKKRYKTVGVLLVQPDIVEILEKYDIHSSKHDEDLADSWASQNNLGLAILFLNLGVWFSCQICHMLRS